MCWLSKLFISSDTAPRPEPVERGQITGLEVHQIIRSKFSTGDIHISDSQTKPVYSLCDIQDIEAFLDVDETNHIKFVQDKFDCDNFARLLWGQFGVPDWAHFAIGLLWSNIHAMVCCIDANGEFWIIEPQTDERRSDLLSSQGTQMRFIII